ncbi:MAG: DUF3592 domain-containing protein, partial [bacterium]
LVNPALHATQPAIFRIAARVVVIGMIVMGIGLLVGSGFVLWRTNTWYATSTTTSGTVIAQALGVSSGQMPANGAGSRGTSTSSRPTRAEVVEFTTPDGARHEFRSRISSSDPFEVGASVPVRYNPADPTDATIDTWFRVWGFPLIFLGAGLIEIVVGIGFLAVARRVAA